MYMSRFGLMFLALLIASISDSASAARRAFVVGISDYPNLPISNLDGPSDDAKLMADLLKRFGFEVTTIQSDKTNPNENADRQKLIRSWSTFLASIDPDDEVVVALSGHGVQIDNTNYFVPRDAPDSELIEADNAAELMVSLSSRISDVRAKQPKIAVWIIDACRENPYFRPDKHGNEIGSTRIGLIPTDAPEGHFIFYSAEARHKALARVASTSPNSLFIGKLVEFVRNNPNTDLDTVAHRVREIVRSTAATQDYNQFPSFRDGVFSWCFQAPCVGSVVSSQSYQTASAKVNVPTGNERKAAAQRPVSTTRNEVHTESFSPGREPSAVYLGRKSTSVNCDDTRVSDSTPFGCAILKKIATGKSQPLIGEQILSRTETNLRQHVPTTSGDYGCVVEVLPSNTTLKLTGILARTVGDDTQYWGTVAGKQKECPRRTSAPH